MYNCLACKVAHLHFTLPDFAAAVSLQRSSVTSQHSLITRSSICSLEGFIQCFLSSGQFNLSLPTVINMTGPHVFKVTRLLNSQSFRLFTPTADAAQRDLLQQLRSLAHDTRGTQEIDMRNK